MKINPAQKERINLDQRGRMPKFNFITCPIRREVWLTRYNGCGVCRFKSLKKRHCLRLDKSITLFSICDLFFLSKTKRKEIYKKYNL